MANSLIERKKAELTTSSQRPLKDEEIHIRLSTYVHMEVTLKMLNESMGMCLPTNPSKRLDPLHYL